LFFNRLGTKVVRGAKTWARPIFLLLRLDSVRFLGHVPPPPNLSGLSRAELEALLVELFGKVAALEQLAGEQREEIARLKGLKGRPTIKPSGMDKGTEPPKSERRGKRRFRGKVTPRVPIEDQVVKVAVPEGSRFKGYEPFLVQDLVIAARATCYQRERWVTPDGRTILAPLPDWVDGHFGPELRRFVLMQYHQGQSTLPRLTALLHSIGLAISKRQLQRLLTDKQADFVSEAQDVLRAGLATSPFVSVDDTGARHAGKNGFCTQIGNDWFTWFGTRVSKSRLNFLDLLRAGHTDYVLNDAAYDYMRKHSLSAPLIACLRAEPQTGFADQAAWLAHLDRLGFTGLDVTPDPVRVATEGALWGSVQSHQFLCEAVVLSDDAGQFNVGRHALCWVHAERLVYKLDAFTDKHRAAQARVRGLIWDYYADLKTYRLKPNQRRSSALRARFDRIFLRRTGFVTLDRLLKRLHANKAELLMVLERPEIPLHTNGSENDIRCYVTRRKVSAGTRSEIGRNCRDAFLGLAKTCDKLGVALWDYLGSRFKVAGHIVIQPLDHYVRGRFRPA
jgi:Transposase IS66 family